jgi:hypothetical protein
MRWMEEARHVALSLVLRMYIVHVTAKAAATLPTSGHKVHIPYTYIFCVLDVQFGCAVSG